MAAARAARYRAGVAYNRVEALLFDLRHRVDTTGKTPMTGLDVDTTAAEHGTGFQSVNQRHLKKVLDELNLPPGHVLVDIGSGKGKVTLVASCYPFRRVVGVEISDELCMTARKNAQLWRARRPTSAPIEIVVANALEYEFSDEDVIVLNNPFDDVFLRQFLTRVEESLRLAPRPLWVLYVNPSERHVLDEHPMFAEQSAFGFFGPGRDVVVYRSVDE
jgi:hypothetical protein